MEVTLLKEERICRKFGAGTTILNNRPTFDFAASSVPSANNIRAVLITNGRGQHTMTEDDNVRPSKAGKGTENARGRSGSPKTISSWEELVEVEQIISKVEKMLTYLPNSDPARAEDLRTLTELRHVSDKLATKLRMTESELYDLRSWNERQRRSQVILDLISDPPRRNPFRLLGMDEVIPFDEDDEDEGDFYLLGEPLLDLDEEIPFDADDDEDEEDCYLREEAALAIQSVARGFKGKRIAEGARLAAAREESDTAAVVEQMPDSPEEETNDESYLGDVLVDTSDDAFPTEDPPAAYRGDMLDDVSSRGVQPAERTTASDIAVLEDVSPRGNDPEDSSFQGRH